MIGRVLDMIRIHQEEDRQSWYGWTIQDYERRLQRAMTDRDLLLQEVDRLYDQLVALDRSATSDSEPSTSVLK